MVVSRVSTQYRSVPVEADSEEATRCDIELLEHHARGDGNEKSASSIPFDGASRHHGKGPTYELIPSPNKGMQTPTINSLNDSDDLDRNQLPSHPRKQKFLAGWRLCVFLSLIGTTLVCVFNVAITLWVWKGGQSTIKDGMGTLFEGSCKKARSMNVWIHLLVNVISTLLLSASNYCMQIISAPSRKELTDAHTKRRWLHIGVPNLRNLRHIQRSRAIIWIILLISSMPLHLIFNSVVFTNLQANGYVVVPTTEPWLQGEPYDESSFMHFNESRLATIKELINLYKPNLTDQIRQEDGSMVPRYQELSTAECFERYNVQFLSNIGNLYLVQDSPAVWRNPDVDVVVFNRSGEFTWHNRAEYENTKPEERGDSEIRDLSSQDINLPHLSMPYNYNSNGWRCPSHIKNTCDVENEHEVPLDRSFWQPYERPVKHCLIEQVPESCQVQFAFPFAVLVIVCNVIKATCMALLLFKFRKHTPLVTMGDAVASFLEYPDPETRGRCLYSRRLIEQGWNWETANGAKKGEFDTEPERFDPVRKRWGSAPSNGRWFATYICFAIAMVGGIVGINQSLVNLPRDPAKIWELGFGSIHDKNLLAMGMTIITATIVANAPQAALSYLYIVFNALFTNMFVAREWSSYNTFRKPLRVSSPVGQQRKTYWLNIPFRYAVPAVGVSSLFHWLASQSIFMVQVNVTGALSRGQGNNHHKNATRISTCGFSPAAIILTFVLGTALAIAGIVVAVFRYYPPGIPLAGSCSAAISAACHPPPDDTDASLRPLQWGAIPGAEKEENGKIVGHCSFSGLAVEIPVPGRYYA